jgi:hypothetical protein
LIASLIDGVNRKVNSFFYTPAEQMGNKVMAGFRTNLTQDFATLSSTDAKPKQARLETRRRAALVAQEAVVLG